LDQTKNSNLRIELEPIFLTIKGPIFYVEDEYKMIED